MSKHDNMADLHAELRDVIRRLRDLETANPLNHAAITGDGIRVLTPGDSGGEPVEHVRIGHAQGKRGFLVKEGGAWVSVGDKLSVHDTDIASAKGRLDLTGNRLDFLETFANSYGPTVNEHGTRLTAVEAGTDSMWIRLPVVEAKATANEAVAWAAKNAVDNHEPRIANVEANKASVSSLNAVDGVADSALTAAQKAQSDLQIMKTVYNNHIDQAHPGLPKMGS